MKAEVSGLSDFNFGQLANIALDHRRSQSICVASSSSDNRYSVTASGSGQDGEFTLADGEFLLPFSVEWSAGPGQSGGTELIRGVILTGQTSTERGPRCKKGPTASLAVIVRFSDLSRARQGNYAGTLNLLIAPE